MSEFQYVAFRAIDAPVSKKNLAYMRKQSSRAEVSSRAFANEYHYGDFSGNVLEMLRRGYDIHLHYANFGVRSLFIRLPQGFPDVKAAEHYFDGDSIRYVKDRDGPDGVLKIEPCYEPDHLEELWNLEHVFDRLVSVRREVLDGDLRPLYLAHLAVSCDSDHNPEETIEASVPAGLGDLTKAQRALAKFWGLTPALLAAAAVDSPVHTAAADSSEGFAKWLKKQPASTKDEWLAELLDSSASKLRQEIRTSFRKDFSHPSWPTSKRGWTISQLESAAEQIRDTAQKKATAETARKRAKKLGAMAKDPKPYLQQAEKLVAQRSTAAYEKVAKLLAELREALADTGQASLPEIHAQKLKQKNPTLHLLTAVLRRKGFVPKGK